MTTSDDAGTTPEERPPRRRGREAAIAAIVAAARELYRERTPGDVTMREVAERANVNRGLLHHYFGTKEDLFTAILQITSEQAAASVRGTGDLLAALAELRQAGDAYARMLGWTLISGMNPDEFVTPSPTIAELGALAQQYRDAASPSPGGEEQRQIDPRVVVAAALTLSMGWQIYEPFMVRAAELTDYSADELRADIGHLIDLMTRTALAPASDDPE